MRNIEMLRKTQVNLQLQNLCYFMHLKRQTCETWKMKFNQIQVSGCLNSDVITAIWKK